MLPTFSPTASASPVTPPPRPIPGSYGPPVLGPLRDRLDYFWFQSQDEFFRRRATANRSTVFRTNIPPTFPFFIGIDPRVVAIVDADAFTALFDPDLVDKRDILIGPYNPGTGFTGGSRVGVYLDTEEPEHGRTKNFAMALLHRSAQTWATELRAGVDGMLDTVEAELAKASGDNLSANYIIPLQQCIFRFLCKALVGADPSVDWAVDKFGFTILDIWLALQILPTQKIGAIQPLEELLIHSFPLPSFIIWPGYNLLYRFVEKHGAEAVAYAEKEHGIGEKDAINNLLFVLGFNAFGGFSVFLPFLVAKIGEAADPSALRPRLREEVRGVLRACGDDGAEFGFKAVREMPLVRSTVYEMLRMSPPVPLQFGRARKDFVLRSHGDVFQVSKGEVLCGYQPLAMRDPEVFERPEEFVPERFIGDEGQALLRHLFWSNGPETSQPAAGNKQCAAKEVVVDTACMLVAELFRRYDDFEVEGTSFTKLVKRQPSPSLSAAAAGAPQ
ncbi:Linolenate hydroperoxide lyase, chloroplastic [Dichanthelium oligosanthes]|uniref:hydroperoxide dehydratase n=1 Tax=Dichanthelium oligosanthes TaxID=888268 RepID=A0A1E5WHY8_9POAL|nr:Linolenate hydroperoxide lyase, chloroplastic [Dichanthelium oligosanthes]